MSLRLISLYLRVAAGHSLWVFVVRWFDTVGRSSSPQKISPTRHLRWAEQVRLPACLREWTLVNLSEEKQRFKIFPLPWTLDSPSSFDCFKYRSLSRTGSNFSTPLLDGNVQAPFQRVEKGMCIDTASTNHYLVRNEASTSPTTFGKVTTTAT